MKGISLWWEKLGDHLLDHSELLFRDLFCDHCQVQTRVMRCPWIFWAVREMGLGFQVRTGVSMERRSWKHHGGSSLSATMLLLKASAPQ